MILLLLMTAGSIQKGECFYFCLTLEEGRGAFKARPEQRSHFWHLTELLNQGGLVEGERLTE